jgi:hypothetical protein
VQAVADAAALPGDRLDEQEQQRRGSACCAAGSRSPLLQRRSGRTAPVATSVPAETTTSDATTPRSRRECAERAQRSVPMPSTNSADAPSCASGPRPPNSSVVVRRIA